MWMTTSSVLRMVSDTIMLDSMERQKENSLVFKESIDQNCLASPKAPRIRLDMDLGENLIYNRYPKPLFSLFPILHLDQGVN